MKIVIMEVQRVPLQRINKYVCWMQDNEMIIGSRYTFAEACELIRTHMRLVHSDVKRYKLLIQHEKDEPRRL